MCECGVCSQHRKYAEIAARGNVDEMRELINELEEHIADAETDRDYYRALLKGQWTGHKRIPWLTFWRNTVRLLISLWKAPACPANTR